MKIKITENLRKYIILYLALVLILYLVIEMIPKVTDIFETTEVLEPGELMLTDEATGYLIKTETIVTSPVSGPIKYLAKEGSLVRKNQEVIYIRNDGGTEASAVLYEDLLQRLEGYSGVVQTGKTPASGLFSLYMDGSEKVLNPEHMDELTQKEIKDQPLHQKDLEQSSVRVGDPIYKITDDNKWYVVCWMNEKKAGNYSEGQSVKLELPDGEVQARVRSIAKESKRKYKVIFHSDVYYQNLTTTREVKMTIQGSEQSGLIVDNDCIVEKDGQTGVYVRDKNGEYNFTRINVIATDGNESVISETKFINPEDGKEILTVRVYDEVLRNPRGELKRDLKEEEKEKQKEAAKKAKKATQATEATQATTATEATETPADAADDTESVETTEETE